jgi:serine/threonine protein phosphatase PrpC
MAEPSKNNPKIFKRDIDFCGKEMLGDRAEQEDYSLFRTLSRSSDLLAVIADGMGGHAAGEVASREAVTAFDKTFVDYPSASIPTKLGAALQQANAELSKLIKANPSLSGMGCTLLGVYVSSIGLHWVSVGDSLLLLFRDGKITRLNADHSMAPVIQESVKQGKLSKQEADAHPNRNALRSAVMGEDLALIDVPEKPYELHKGDVLIIASDGLLTLTDSQITDYLKRHQYAGADVIASTLINAVDQKRKPKQDNTTVQVISVPDFIGVRRGFSLKGYFIAPFIALIIGLIASYAYLGISGIESLLSRVIGSSNKPAPVPVPVAPTAPLSEVLAPSVSSSPSAPGLDSRSTQKVESEPTKKSKPDKHEVPQPKPRSGKSSDTQNKKDSKAATDDGGSGTPEIKPGSDLPETFKEDLIKRLFVDPPSTPPQNKKNPNIEVIKSDT